MEQGLGTYLGIPVLIVEDLGDGWVICVCPDQENPKKRRGKTLPFTYNKGEAYKHWSEQITVTHQFPVNINYDIKVGTEV